VDTQEDSKKLAEKQDLPFPLLADEDLKVAMAYGVAMEGRDIAVPAVFVVLPDGSVFYRKIGESVADRPTSHELMDVVNRALAETREKQR